MTNVVGAVTCNLKNGKTEIKEEIIIVKGLQRPLLGLGACEDLQLVQRLSAIIECRTSVDAKKEFPKLFTGLGKLDVPYSVKIRDDARPFAVHSPRRVPIPLMNKVKEKLKLMVEQGVIEPVDEPSDWCAPMVTAPKSGGHIRLCVDLTQLNRSVEREYYPMPVVEHT